MGQSVLAAAFCLAVISCAYGKAFSSPAPAPSSLSIAAYGAVPDGMTDSTIAIKRAISAARNSGRSVFVPAGTFVHTSFSLDGVGMVGAGSDSTLLSPRAVDSNIYLRGSGASLRDLTVKVKSSHRDARNFAVFVDGADHFLIDSVRIIGGNGGGIFDFGGSDGKIVHNRIENTLADAIHNTHGAHDVIVAENTVRHAGDDMIAVVSYLGQPLSHDILIKGNDLADQEYGRGISVVGGMNITIQDNTIVNTECCAGIYIASEANWKTAGVDNVVVRGNTLIDNSGPTGHGAIMIFAEKNVVRNVSVEENMVVRARHSAVTVVGNASEILIVGNAFSHPAEAAVSGDSRRMDCARNLLDGQPLDTAVCSAQGSFAATGASASLGR
nr:glycosyl hydrolase family 28-related protein [uncultured Rhodopila sp.]